MFPQLDESVTSASTISVTVTAYTRPSVLERTTLNSSPHDNNSTVPTLDTPTITQYILNSLSGGDNVKASGIPTRTTPTLTPTTLRNIEQIFESPSVQPPEVHFNQAGFVPPPVQISSGSNSTYEFISVDNKALGGGVTTLSQLLSPSSVSSSSSRSSSPMPSLSLTKSSSGRRMGGRKPKFDDSASPEEEVKKQLRRERNKQAAARCRKRRMDQTSRLQDETEILEEKRKDLQEEIQSLQSQRQELVFLLETHKPICEKDVGGRQSPLENLVIKEEPVEDSGKILEEDIKPQRPTSLALGGSRSIMTDLGLTIETPSHGLRGFGLNFESMMEGGTGLTPVSAGVGHTGLTPLTTPIVTSVPTSNCGTQLRSSSCELVSPDSVPHKLVSL